MGFLDIEHDKVNKIVLKKLIAGFREEMGKILMETAKQEIEKAIDIMCKRIELKVNRRYGVDDLHRHIKLEWVISDGGPSVKKLGEKRI